MSLEAVGSNVKSVFRATFPERDLGQLDDETPIVEGMGLSSLEIIKLFAQLENTFDIDLINNIDPEQVGHYRVKDLSDIVERMTQHA